MKRNNNSIYFKDWTNKKLKDEARKYHQTIYEIGCYGKEDLRIYDGICAELDNRERNYY